MADEKKVGRSQRMDVPKGDHEPAEGKPSDERNSSQGRMQADHPAQEREKNTKHGDRKEG